MTSGNSEKKRAASWLIPDGYYWVQFGTGEPEIIEKMGDNIFQFNVDLPIYYEGGKWKSYGRSVDITWLSGPLANPTSEGEV